MQPEAEFVHWLFATGFLVLGICLLAESIVGPEVWGRNPWRPHLWPGAMFVAFRQLRSPTTCTRICAALGPEPT